MMDCFQILLSNSTCASKARAHAAALLCPDAEDADVAAGVVDAAVGRCSLTLSNPR